MTARDDRSEYPLGPALEFLQRLWELGHELETLSGHMADRLGITAQQRFVIRCLGRYPGLSAGALAAILRVDPGTVSATLRRLERRGLVQRRRDPRDQRRVALALTARGRALDRPMPETVEHAVERVLSEAVPAELESTARVLGLLIERLRDEHRG